MSPKTIAITAFNRPHYFEQLLCSLVKNNLDDWKVYIQIEPSDKVEQFIEIANRLLKGNQYQLDVNETRLGVRQNPYSLLTKVFQKGSTLNIYLEEDMVVSSDLTQLASWYQGLDHSKLLCVNLMLAGCFSSGFLSSRECPLATVKTKCFNSLGFIITQHQWETHFAPHWFRFPKHFRNINGDQADGWDLAIYDYLLSQAELQVLSPLLARANHTGKHGGSYCSEHFHVKSFENLPIYQGEAKVHEYSVIADNNTLPYSVKAHLNLWQEMTQSLITLKREARFFRILRRRLGFVKKIIGWHLLKNAYLKVCFR